MLRTLILVLALGAPSVAAAEQFPDTPLGLEVRGHDGTVLGRIENVERDAEGRITSVEIPGLEPEDAPAPSQMVAQNDRRLLSPDRARLARERVLASNTNSTTRR